MFNLLIVALLITVIIWMVITTILFSELQKQVVALKELETKVIETQNGDIKETLKSMTVLGQILEYISEDAKDSYDIMKTVIEEANENKKFAIKTVLRAQEVLKKCNVIREEMMLLNKTNTGEKEHADRKGKNTGKRSDAA